jgi:hypothetical protein
MIEPVHAAGHFDDHAELPITFSPYVGFRGHLARFHAVYPCLEWVAVMGSGVTMAGAF